MKVSQETIIKGRAKFSRGRSSFVVIFGVMLVVFGVILITIGHDVVGQRSYDMPWKASRSVFAGLGTIQSTSGVAHFQSSNAVRMGVGFALFGALLALWGVIVLWDVFRPSRPEVEKTARPQGAGLVLGIASLIMLVAAQACFFPVWQTEGLVFWCIVVGMPVITGLFKRAGKTGWGGRLFIALVVLAVLIPAPRISFAVVTGIFGSLFCIAHLMFLFPDFCSEEDRPSGHNCSSGATLL
ncbi:MAG TPA: hypothetical protein VH413_08945 [Verrucomicrobiae bacterium]|jgi:hypothetical protein|nr:hypothetical protein [Verrucomicrobiae bacterium]